MASASSNRYQSRLFSFIHKQSCFLTNRLNRVLKSVTRWIAPIVLYPSLPQEIKQNVRPLPKSNSAPPKVDTPIEKVLLLIEVPPEESVTANPIKNFLGFLSNKFFPKVSSKLSTNTNSRQLLQSADNNSSNSLVQRPQVQGIASLISNRLLVLVTPHNEVLDVLTSQQQQVLQERIIGEVANYWRWQRLLQSKQDKLPARQTWLLAPTKVFDSIVTWGRKDRQQLKISFFPTNAIASLDRTIAKFETDNLAPVASKSKAFQIQGLIWAAIDYFFGDRTGKLIQPTQTTIDNELADPWLTMSDLFGSEVVEQSLILEHPTNSTGSYLPEDKNLTQSQEINKYSLQNLLNRWRHLTQKVGSKNLTSLSVKSPQAATNLTKINQQKTSAQLNQNSNSYTKRQATIATNSPGSNLSSSVATKPPKRPEQSDWIETNATTMGYVKHPLEQLLEWLDLAILWVENIFVKFWHWLQQD